MKKMNIFKRVKKDWVSTEVTIFPATKESWEEAYQMADKIRNDKKKVCVSMTMDYDKNYQVKVEVFEKKRLAH